MSDLNSRELLEHFLDGKGNAASAIFDRYAERLLAFARSRIGVKLQKRLDPEDVVQSAYRSFFLQATRREYHLNHSGDLWRLLAATTLNKVLAQVEKQTALKRSIDRETAENAFLAQVSSREPTVEEAFAVTEQLIQIMKKLSGDERTVLQSTLQGATQKEICQTTGKSQRTIRRLVAQVKQKFEEHLLESNGVETIASRVDPTVQTETTLNYNDYVLQKMLGSGGMGKVYRAKVKQSGKTVAIKSLRKSRQHDARAVEMFVQESQVLSKLKHPNIVGIEGLGRFPTDGYFIVMDFVDGTDLQTRLRSGTLPVSESIPLMKKVAAAVQFAHDNGIVHSDLKPANILVDNHHHVYVVDFGFAYLASDVAKSKTGIVGGTSGFIAPEVLELKSPPTASADIYAIGSMLWVLTTGKMPSGPEEIRDANQINQPLVLICQKCLAKDPNDRFKSMSELVEALNAVQWNE